MITNHHHMIAILDQPIFCWPKLLEWNYVDGNDDAWKDPKKTRVFYELQKHITSYMKINKPSSLLLADFPWKTLVYTILSPLLTENPSMWTNISVFKELLLQWASFPSLMIMWLRRSLNVKQQRFITINKELPNFYE